MPLEHERNRLGLHRRGRGVAQSCERTESEGESPRDANGMHDYSLNCLERSLTAHSRPDTNLTDITPFDWGA